MTAADLEHFRALLAEREQSLSALLCCYDPGDEAKAGQVRAVLAEIKDALGRVAHESYGVCTVCKGEVELHRLEVQPATQVCLACISDGDRALLEEELFLASKVHRALLPQQVEHIAGFDVAVQSRAVRIVGGDYYDFLPTTDGSRVRVVIADSMGKGLPAGLLMSNLQGALRILAEGTVSPGPLVTRLNQWLCRNIPLTKFITLACVQVETNGSGDARLVHANAGHCPPLLARADGTVEQLEATGTVLGVRQDFTVGEQPLAMHPGDLLLLYTDGITEAEDGGGDMFGDGRLIDLVRANRGRPVEAVVETILDELHRFCGREEFGDDFTLIALRKRLP